MSKYPNLIVTITLLLCWSGCFDYNAAAQSTSYASGKPLNYRELMNKLRSPQNGLGDIYQIDIGALNIGK